MLDQAIRKKRLLGERHKINKAIIQYLRDHKGAKRKAADARREAIS